MRLLLLPALLLLFAACATHPSAPKIDAPPDVLIDAQAVIVSDNFLDDFGLEWDVGTAAAPKKAIFLHLDAWQLNIFLRAIKADKQSAILITPRTSQKIGQPFTLNLGDLQNATSIASRFIPASPTPLQLGLTITQSPDATFTYTLTSFSGAANPSLQSSLPIQIALKNETAAFNAGQIKIDNQTATIVIFLRASLPSDALASPWTVKLPATAPSP